MQDVENGLYEKYYLNFISPLPRRLLEELAASALRCENVLAIQRVRLSLCLSASLPLHSLTLLLSLSLLAPPPTAYCLLLTALLRL